MRSVYNFTKHKRVERKVLPVVDIIADIFAFLQLKVQETEATLVLDVKKGLTAWCDKTLIGQAILNLALNGLEALKGQPCVRRELRISAANVDAASVQFTVPARGIAKSSCRERVWKSG